MTYLIVTCAVLSVAVLVMGYGLYKLYKDSKTQQRFTNGALDAFNLKTEKQGQDIHTLSEKTDNIVGYNQAMAYLLLEEQKSYIYTVAFALDSLIKKNDVLVRYELISAESAKMRNYQLASLRGSLQQYGDSLTFAQRHELPKGESSSAA